jgi:tRNA-binding protein
MAAFEAFLGLDIGVGKIVEVLPFPEARKPAYRITIDFGREIGLKKTSAQLTKLYGREDLLGRQVVAVINFPPKQVGNFISEVLILGAMDEKGVILLQPERQALEGDRIA